MIRFRCTSQQGNCLLCGLTNNERTLRAVLHHDEIALGLVCDDCLEGTPGEAAERIRRRAEDSRSLVLEAQRLPLNKRPEAQRLFLEHAWCLENLADCVERLPVWLIEEQSATRSGRSEKSTAI